MKHEPTYYEQVRDQVEQLAGATTSDAQSIIEAWELKTGQSVEEEEQIEGAAPPYDMAMQILSKPAPDQAPTKAQEVAALRSFQDQQHPSSYLAQWLKVMIPHVEQDMRNDLIPEHTPQSMRDQVREDLMRKVREEIGHQYRELTSVQEQVKEAKAQLAKVNAAEIQAARYKDAAARQLRQALKDLED